MVNLSNNQIRTPVIDKKSIRIYWLKWILFTIEQENKKLSNDLAKKYNFNSAKLEEPEFQTKEANNSK